MGPPLYMRSVDRNVGMRRMIVHYVNRTVEALLQE